MHKSLSLSFLLILLPLIISAQTVPVTFNVDVSYQIEQGKFDPETETVDIAGSFNGWGSTYTQMFDPDEDSVYTVTLNGFNPGEEIAFKFRYNGEWGGREELPGAGNDRYYTVQDSNNVLFFYYNNEIPYDGELQAGFSSTSTFLYAGSLMSFENTSLGDAQNFEWTFQGGQPETSTDENPVIRYPGAGVFDVQLIVWNEEERDTLKIEDYLTVEFREIGEPKWWNDRVFYEIFVRSFYDSDGDGIGDFKGLTQKIDYMNDGDPLTDSDLGITGIWLMPINPSPSYHGYDVTDYTAINPDYGTMEDFKEFLSAAHNRGIAVIIDFVMNHSSSQHPWFEASRSGDPFYRSFYRWSDTNPGYNGPWGQQVWHQSGGDYYYGLFWGGMPDLNYENQALKDSMFAYSDFWINEIGIDGFRQDAVLYIHEDGDTLKNTQKTLDFWQEFNLNMKSNNPDAFNVGEAWEPTDIVLKYISNDRMDYAFEFDLANAILFSVNTGDAGPLTGQMEKVYNVYPTLQYGTFLTNHDQNRVMNVLGEDVEKNKIAAAIYLTLPGIPYLYYGEEIGQLGTKPDEDIRRPLQWNDDISAGFSTDPSPWRAPYSDFPTKNIEAQQQDPSSLWTAYRDLIQLRNQYPELRTGDYETAIVDDQRIYAFKRSADYDNSRYNSIVVVNLGDQDIADYQMNFGIGSSEIVANLQHMYSTSSEATELMPSNSAGGQFFEGQNLPARSAHVFTYISLLTSNEDTHQPDRFELEQNFPNPFNPSTQIQFNLPVATDVSLKVYDITGRLIQTLADGQYPAGTHQVTFDASAFASGVYLYRLESPNAVHTRKMLLIK